MLVRTSGNDADVDEDFPDDAIDAWETIETDESVVARLADDAFDDLETIEMDESVAGIGEVG